MGYNAPRQGCFVSSENLEVWGRFDNEDKIKLLYIIPINHLQSYFYSNTINHFIRKLEPYEVIKYKLLGYMFDQI